MALVGVLLWDGITVARDQRMMVQHSRDTLEAIKNVSLVVRDAETGQRGYLLTGEDAYLRPYETSVGRIPQLEEALAHLVESDPVQQDRLRALVTLMQLKTDELAETVRLRRDHGLDASLQMVRTDRGQALMNGITGVLSAMEAAERIDLDHRYAIERNGSTRLRWIVMGGAGMAMVLLAVAGSWLARARREAAEAERQERRQAEQLRTSLDSLSQGVGVFSPDRMLVNWNAGFATLLDVARARLQVGTPYAVLAGTTADGPAGPVLEADEQLAGSLGWYGGSDPVVHERVTAGARMLEIRRTAMRGGGFVITLTDITQRIRTEDVLRDTQKMQAIGQLTGGIAHDFNNLLTIIIGNLEAVLKRLEDAGLRQRIERALWGAQRGAKLTGHLLAFARKQPLEPVPINFGLILPDIVTLLKRTLGEHIEIRVVEAAGLWNAMADPAQLESAVLNLALNARDAMPDGGRLTIEIGNRVLDEAYARQHTETTQGDYAMLAVSDTGSGMTPEIIARVFEPFFTTKPIGKGTGLGMAMVYGFIKQSRGHVQIYSEPGEGTSVKLYLPRAAAAKAPQRPQAPIELARGNARILVIEDEPDVREIAAGTLRDIGYSVLEAGDGDSALRLFEAQAEKPDMLLVDVVLPGRMKGRQVAEQIVAMSPETRVLYMSGYTENAIVHHGRLDEGVQLIGKPFQRDQLVRKVAEVLHQTNVVSAAPNQVARPAE